MSLGPAAPVSPSVGDRALDDSMGGGRLGARGVVLDSLLGGGTRGCARVAIYRRPGAPSIAACHPLSTDN